MEQAIFVYVDLDGMPIKVGQLWSHYRNGRESMSFEYDRAWLNHPKRFSFDPALKLVAGSFHASADKPLFGAIDDSAPDRWGRLLMRRFERKNAEHEKRTARALKEIDFLLMVDDEGRQGALRFKKKDQEEYLTTYDKNHIPPLVTVGKLLIAANNVLQESDSEEDLRLLFAPGSSLGGARPKAFVKDIDGHLAIAKFSRKDDEMDIIAWEAVALSLADKAGIKLPEWRLEPVGRKHILLSRRFDRKKNIRIPFLSAMSVLAAKDLAVDVAHYFNLDNLSAKYILKEVGSATALWRKEAAKFKIKKTEIDRMASAFEHEDLQKALK